MHKVVHVLSMDSYTLHVHVPFWSIQRVKSADLPTFFSAPAIRVCMYVHVDLSLLCSHIHVHVQHVQYTCMYMYTHVET